MLVLRFASTSMEIKLTDRPKMPRRLREKRMVWTYQESKKAQVKARNVSQSGRRAPAMLVRVVKREIAR